MSIGTHLSFRKFSPFLPQTVDTVSQRTKATLALLSKGRCQDEKLLIKVCLREIIINKKKNQRKSILGVTTHVTASG